MERQPMPPAPPDFRVYHEAIRDYVQTELDAVFSLVFVAKWGQEEKSAGLSVVCPNPICLAVRSLCDDIEDLLTSNGHSVTIVVHPNEGQ